jgi:hypothetical protein
VNRIRRSHHNHSVPPRPSRAPFLARLAVWAVLVLGVLAGVVGTNAVDAQARATAASSVASLAGPDVVQGPGTSAPDVSSGSYRAATGPVVGDQAQGAAGLAAQADSVLLTGDPLSLSPAWRWTSLPMQQDNGSDRIVDTVMNAFASICFAIAEWLWLLILFMVRLSAGADILSKALRGIDAGAVAVANQPLLITAIAVGWLVTLWKMGKFALRGNVVKMFSTLATFLIPIAFLFYIGNIGIQQAVSASSGNASGYVAPTGSPGWMAKWVTQKLDFIGSTTIELVDGSVSDLTVGSGESWCAKYVKTLEALQPPNSKTAVVTSVGSLWQVAYLTNWTNAAFGDGGQGEHVYCYYLDAANGIRPADTQAIQAQAWPEPGGGSTYLYEALYEPMEGGGKVAVFSWIACRWNGGGWEMRDDWRKVKPDDNGPSLDGDGKEIEYCTKWYAGGTKSSSDLDRKELQNYIKVDGKDADNFAHFRNGNISDITPDAPAARSVADGYLGRNSTIRLGTGLITLVTAGFYGFALVGLSAGALMAQFALVLLLIFLPVTLILLALGSDKGQKMLRMTVSLMAAKLLFSVLLAVMISIITLGVSLVKPLTEGLGGEAVQAGLIQSIAISLVPLGALWVVRRIAGAAGLGNITSLKGGMGFTMAAAQKAGRAGSMSDLTGSKMNDSYLGRKRTQLKDATKTGAANVAKYPIRARGRRLEQKRLQGRMEAADRDRGALAKDIQDGKFDGEGLSSAKTRLRALDEQIRAESAKRNPDKEKLKRLTDDRDQLSKKIDGGTFDSPELTDKKAELARLDAKRISMSKRYGHLTTEMEMDREQTMRTLKYAGLGAAGVLTLGAGGALAGVVAATGLVSTMTAAGGIGLLGARATGAVMARRAAPGLAQASDVEAEVERELAQLTANERAEAQQVAIDQARAAQPTRSTSDARGRSAAERDVARRAAVVAASTPGRVEVVEATAALDVAEDIAHALGAPETVTASYRRAMATNFAQEMGVSHDKVGVSDQGIPVLLPYAFSAQERLALRPDVAARPEFALLGGNLGPGVALAEEAYGADGANLMVGLLSRSGGMRVDGGQVVTEDWLASANIDLSTAIGQQKYANIINGNSPAPAISLADDRAAQNVIRGLAELAQPGRDAIAADLQAGFADLREVSTLCTELGSTLTTLRQQVSMDSSSPVAQLVDQLSRTSQVASSGGADAQAAQAAIPVVRAEIDRMFTDQIATLRAAVPYAAGLGGMAAGLGEGNLQEKWARASEADREAEALAAELRSIEEKLDEMDPQEVMKRFDNIAAKLNGVVSSLEGAIDEVQSSVQDALDDVYVPPEPTGPKAPARIRANRNALGV